MSAPNADSKVTGTHNQPMNMISARPIQLLVHRMTMRGVRLRIARQQRPMARANRVVANRRHPRARAYSGLSMCRGHPVRQKVWIALAARRQADRKDGGMMIRPPPKRTKAMSSAI